MPRVLARIGEAPPVDASRPEVTGIRARSEFRSAYRCEPVHSVAGEMGFFSRLLVPRSARRAMHPGRAVKRVVTPKMVKKASRAMHPIDNAVYSMQRSVATSLRSGRKGKARVYRHGRCPINHRSPEAAAKCLSLASLMGPGCCHEEGTTWRHE